MLYPGVGLMKLFTKSSILKSTTVEIVSPRIVECPNLERGLNKQAMPQGVPVDFPDFSVTGESVIHDLAEDYQPTSSVEIKNEEITTMIAEARAQADQIIAEANRQAQEIIANAHLEAETIQNRIEQKVRDEVTPLAQAAGFETGLKEAAEESQRLRLQAKAYLELAQRVLMDEYNQADRDIMKVCLQISEKIIHTSLNLEPEKLLSIVRSLTVLPLEKEGMKIHLSVKDWEWYRNLPAEDKPPYPVVIDETLRAGDAFLECAEGIFDARISSQLQKIEQYLAEELDHGRLDGFSEED